MHLWSFVDHTCMLRSPSLEYTIVKSTINISCGESVQDVRL
jgi:hypothetical protein